MDVKSTNQIKVYAYSCTCVDINTLRCITQLNQEKISITDLITTNPEQTGNRCLLNLRKKISKNYCKYHSWENSESISFYHTPFFLVEVMAH